MEGDSRNGIIEILRDDGKKIRIHCIADDAQDKCANCGREKTEVRLCKGCLIVAYCSIDCQRNDWIKGHKNKCKKLHKLQ